jgi:SAM-dependent methyltransferase
MVTSAGSWSSGQAYEPYAGRWSRLVAPAFVEWLEPRPGLRWLDLGCGTGAVTQTALALAAPEAVLGVDRSLAYLEVARAGTSDPRGGFVAGSAGAVPVRASTFDCAVSGLVLNFLPDPLAALRDAVEAVRPGGVVAAYVWDYAGEMQFMRRFWDAAGSLDPRALELDQGRRFPMCQPEPLAELFTEAGMHDVEVRGIDIPTRFANFDDYWTPFLGGQGDAPTYLAGLNEDERERLRTSLQATLPTAEDGSIPLVARAWAVRGRR